MDELHRISGDNPFTLPTCTFYECLSIVNRLGLEILLQVVIVISSYSCSGGNDGYYGHRIASYSTKQYVVFAHKIPKIYSTPSLHLVIGSNMVLIWTDTIWIAES